MGGVKNLTTYIVGPDLQVAKTFNNDYMPVVFPGFSWANLKGGENKLNAIPRLGGKFYWEQIYQYLAEGSHMLYGAMFDEIDKGTAIMKTAGKINQTPVSPKFLSLDADGIQLPSDWYLKIFGYGSSVLKGKEQLHREFPFPMPKIDN